MSLFRGKPLTVALCPAEIGIVWCAQAGEVQRDVVPYSAEAEGSGGLAGLDALARWLDAHAAVRGRLSLVLSSRFVRFALLPWQKHYLNNAEERVWEQMHFESLYGVMQGWHIASDAGRYGQARVACAVPDTLIREIQALCSARGLARGAIVPYFICAWNHWASTVRPGQLFGIAESGSVVFALRSKAGWQSLRVKRARADLRPEELAKLAAQELILQGCTAEHSLKLHVPGGHGPGGSEKSASSTPIEWLTYGAQSEASASAMARLMECAK